MFAEMETFMESKLCFQSSLRLFSVKVNHEESKI